MTPSKRLALATLPLALALPGCEEPEPELEVPEVASRDWPEIVQRDTLTAVTAFNSTSYFIYRGEPMGFEYELLQAFAEEHDLALEVEVVEDRSEIVERTTRGQGDLAAARLSPAAEYGDEVTFTRALYSTPPTIVQRSGPPEEVPEAVDTVVETRPETFPELPEAEPQTVRARLVQRPSQLEGEEVHVPSNAAYQERLVEISDTLDGDIEVIEVEGEVAAEALIRSVARGGIELAATPENLAELRESYFTNLVVKPTLGAPMKVAWAVPTESVQLQQKLDEWFARDSTQALVRDLYEKYFRDRRGYQERVESEYLTSETGQLSQYDALLREEAREIGWDWRLLASQAYQESKFDADARSWAGAQGLLQLMPGTAREVGVTNVNDPAENVAGAVRYLRKLMDQWEDDIPQPEERLKFILASYNVGSGHVQDAQRLAEKHGDDPKSWEDVSYWLLQKSKKTVYSDPVVKYGFARGLEPVTYVSRILDRFDHYRQMVESPEETP